MKNEPIIVERVYNAPIAKVWSAITNNDELKLWYFKLEDFKPEVGFKFEFMGGPEDGIQYRHLCEVTEVIKGKKIAYSWRYDGYPGNSLVSWELFERGDKTLLKLTHEGIETIAVAGPDFARSNFVAGWDSFVNEVLLNYLEPIKA